MSTENGLAKMTHARRNIERLRSRAEFLSGRIDQYIASGHADKAGFDQGELRALEWALPILETEWDNLARIRRDVVPGGAT